MVSTALSAAVTMNTYFPLYFGSISPVHFTEKLSALSFVASGEASAQSKSILLSVLVSLLLLKFTPSKYCPFSPAPVPVRLIFTDKIRLFQVSSFSSRLFCLGECISA